MGEKARTHASSLKSTLHLSFQFDSLNFSPGLQNLSGAFIDPVWTVHDKLSLSFKLLVKTLFETRLMSESSSSYFVAPKPTGIQAFVGLP